MSADKQAALVEALDQLDKGAWQEAHVIVQSDDSPIACWAHGIVHVMEGDFDNARYWYGRAQREFEADASAERAALRATLTGR